MPFIVVNENKLSLDNLTFEDAAGLFQLRSSADLDDNCLTFEYALTPHKDYQPKDYTLYILHKSEFSENDKDFGVELPLPEEPVRCYDDLEVAALNTVTNEVSTQPTLLDVLDQVASQKQPEWVNYQNQLLLVVGPLQEEALLEALEDCIDNANADAALREGGKPIPWEQVKQQLGW